MADPLSETLLGYTNAFYDMWDYELRTSHELALNMTAAREVAALVGSERHIEALQRMMDLMNEQRRTAIAEQKDYDEAENAIYQLGMMLRQGSKQAAGRAKGRGTALSRRQVELVETDVGALAWAALRVWQEEMKSQVEDHVFRGLVD